MKTCPIELRERIIAAVDDQVDTIAETAAIFEVSERFIYKLLNQRREAGHIQADIRAMEQRRNVAET